MKSRNIVIIFLAFALLLLVGCQPAQQNTITVTGDSEITVDPNQAEVWAGASFVKDTAEQAQSEVNKVINAIVAGLKTEGIAESDIATEQLSLSEERDWTQDGSKFLGWRASQNLKIKTTDMTKVGKIVDVAVANGANQINNINFGLTNEKEQLYKQQALADATANAKSKAETIAASLGATLGKIMSVSEANYYYTPYRYAMTDSAGAKAAPEAAAVMPGKVSVTGQISLVYAVKQP